MDESRRDDDPGPKLLQDQRCPSHDRGHRPFCQEYGSHCTCNTVSVGPGCEVTITQCFSPIALAASRMNTLPILIGMLYSRATFSQVCSTSSPSAPTQCLWLQVRRILFIDSSVIGQVLTRRRHESGSFGRSSMWSPPFRPPRCPQLRPRPLSRLEQRSI